MALGAFLLVSWKRVRKLHNRLAKCKLFSIADLFGIHAEIRAGNAWCFFAATSKQIVDILIVIETSRSFGGMMVLHKGDGR